MPYSDPNIQRNYQKRLMRKRRAAGLVEDRRVRTVSLDDAHILDRTIARAWGNATFAVDGIGLG